MARVCNACAVLLLVLLFASELDCRRGGGYSRPSHSRPSASRPSYSRPAPAPAPAPSYYKPAPAPSPSYHRPAPAPAPSYGWNTHVAKPAPSPISNSYKPSAPLPPPGQSNFGVQPLGKQHVGQQHGHNPSAPSLSNTHQGNAPQGPPIGWNVKPQSGVHTPAQSGQNFGVAHTPLNKPGQAGGQSNFGVNKPPLQPGQPGYSPIAASSNFGVNKPPLQPGHTPGLQGQSNFGVNKPPLQPGQPGYSPIVASASNPSLHGIPSAGGVRPIPGAGGVHTPITPGSRTPIQSGYPQQQGYYHPQNNPYPQQQGGYYNPGYGGYHQQPHYGGYGGPPPGYGGYGGGGYPGGYGGYPGGYGGYGGGGYGGGGFGGFGGGGYGGGYGGGGVFRQSNNGWKYFIAGALVSRIFTGSSHRDYTVYNYYNRGERKEDIHVQTNSIIGCPQNASLICPDGTFSMCTNDLKILCVTTATVPCNTNTTANCVSSKFTPPPCVNGQSDAGPCNGTAVFNSTTINIPCVTNASILGDLKDLNATVLNSSLLFHDGTPTHFCVTTIAIPREPRSPPPPEKPKVTEEECNDDDDSLKVSQSPFGNGTVVLNVRTPPDAVVPWPVVTNLVNVGPASGNVKKCDKNLTDLAHSFRAVARGMA